MGARLTVRGSARMTRLQKLQKKAPKVLKSLDAKLKSAPVAAGNAGRARWPGIVREAWSGRPPTVGSVGRPDEADWPHEGEGKVSWPQTIEKSRNGEGISLRSRRGARKPCSQSVSASPIGAACFAACAIAASAAWPAGWVRPADMISLAASSGDIGSSMMSLVGTKK